MARAAVFLVVALSLLGVAAAEVAARDVLVLDESNFKSTIDDHSKAYFVKFFAPWCGHCKRLAPTWAELAAAKVAPEVVVAHVDCTASRSVCEEQEIRGYPTLKVFVKGEGKEKYSGGRDLAALSAYVQEVAEDFKDSLASAEAKAADVEAAA
ncbi:hypothetical protein CLOM_g18638 [Closterium sp. NIES-68]|nr:hypothetical protein CLOM_g18638 [Closterium sp. NIES-68]GJP81821.1 hypothetical protein CLOP_g11941 [Closterium sp. NIES-67]